MSGADLYMGPYLLRYRFDYARIERESQVLLILTLIACVDYMDIPSTMEKGYPKLLHPMLSPS